MAVERSVLGIVVANAKAWRGDLPIFSRECSPPHEKVKICALDCDLSEQFEDLTTNKRNPEEPNESPFLRCLPPYVCEDSLTEKERNEYLSSYLLDFANILRKEQKGIFAKCRAYSTHNSSLPGFYHYRETLSVEEEYKHFSEVDMREAYFSPDLPRLRRERSGCIKNSVLVNLDEIGKVSGFAAYGDFTVRCKDAVDVRVVYGCTSCGDLFTFGLEKRGSSKSRSTEDSSRSTDESSEGDDVCEWFIDLLVLSDNLDGCGLHHSIDLDGVYIYFKKDVVFPIEDVYVEFFAHREVCLMCGENEDAPDGHKECTLRDLKRLCGLCGGVWTCEEEYCAITNTPIITATDVVMVSTT